MVSPAITNLQVPEAAKGKTCPTLLHSLHQNQKHYRVDRQVLSRWVTLAGGKVASKDTNQSYQTKEPDIVNGLIFWSKLRQNQAKQEAVGPVGFTN